MQPRILFRTHYQVDEPAYVAVLVKSCTSPVQSAYDERVAEKLSREVRGQSKEFNVAAAGYALDLARGLGVVSDQNVWSEKGHLLSLVVEPRGGPWTNGLELTFRERLLFFRLFLEGDGAGLLYLAKRLATHGQIPHGDEDWNALARDMFLAVFAEYLQLTGTTADRVTLRNEIDRIRAKGYSGKSGTHKLFVHLQTLCRLGLVGRVETGGARVYQSDERSARQLSRLVEEVPGAQALEEIVRDHRWAEIAARVFADGREAERIGEEELLRLLVPKYLAVAATGVPLVSLSTVIEAIQIDQIAQRSGFVTYAGALDALQEGQKHRASDIRFHVDRRGTPAFIKLSGQLVAQYGETGKLGAS